LQPVKMRTRERSEWSGHEFAGCSKMFWYAQMNKSRP
jgi:hypothetical protein